MTAGWEKGRLRGPSIQNGRGKPRKPVRSALPVMRDLFRIVDRTGLSYEALAKKAGCHKQSLTNWRRGEYSPYLQQFENMATALGYEIVLRKKE